MQEETFKTEEPADVQTGVLLKRAQAALRYRMDDALQELGLTTPQFAVLSALRRAPGATNAELARLSFVTPQTMNAMLALLEGTGLVERSGHATNRRLIPIRLTDKGRETLARAEGVADGVDRELTDLFEPAELATFRECLARCALRPTKAASRAATRKDP